MTVGFLCTLTIMVNVPGEGLNVRFCLPRVSALVFFTEFC